MRHEFVREFAFCKPLRPLDVDVKVDFDSIEDAQKLNLHRRRHDTKIPLVFEVSQRPMVFVPENEQEKLEYHQGDVFPAESRFLQLQDAAMFAARSVATENEVKLSSEFFTFDMTYKLVNCSHLGSLGHWTLMRVQDEEFYRSIATSSSSSSLSSMSVYQETVLPHPSPIDSDDLESDSV